MQRAKECPETLQAVCFELLLKNYLDSLSPKPPKTPKSEAAETPETPPADRSKPDEKKQSLEEVVKSQDDLAESDVHIKVRHFMKKCGVTMEQLNNLFYTDGGTIAALYEDLKTTRMAEGQIRIALLQALRGAMSTGEFQTQVEDVRAEANVRKCYDLTNFTGNFKKNAELFDFETYDKSTKILRLSEAGRKELAEVIKELQ